MKHLGASIEGLTWFIEYWFKRMALHGIIVRHGAFLLGGLLFAATAHSQSATPGEPLGEGTGQRHGIEQRLNRIERFLEAHSLLELAQSISALRDEIRLLRGQLEEQQHQIGKLQQQQREIYTDLDRRVQILSKRGLATPDNADPTTDTLPDPADALPDPAGDIANLVETTDPTTGGNSTDVVVTAKTASPTTDASPDGTTEVVVNNQGSAESAEPATISIPAADPLRVAAEYDRAFSQMRSGNYRKALASFTNWLESYQDTPQRANALFWKAEILYIQQNYADAIVAYQELLQKHPANRKREQALLKMGYSQDALGDLTTAINTLERVVQNFPGSAVSQLAQKRLTEIRARNNTPR